MIGGALSTRYFMFNRIFEPLWPGRSMGNVVRKVLASNLIGYCRHPSRKPAKFLCLQYQTVMLCARGPVRD